MENKKIKIDLGFASLVVEAGNDQMKEVYVGLEDSNGAWFQDLTVIGQKYHVDGENIAYDEGIRVRVFADKDNEDYTHSFDIDIFKDKSKEE
ncbi:hypothetical protein GPK77_00610 [Butyricicoccus faecihominis]|nr:hypothetical protein [Butyricicoccus faecihominis]MBT9816252.1 hypothetical protein [Butyricicoccus faecihominis]